MARTLVIPHMAKNRYNKKKLKQQFNDVVERVTKKPIYVVKKSEVGYVIFDHTQQRIVMAEDIPLRSTADKVCAAFNKGHSRITFGKRYNELTDLYFKHLMDIRHFNNALRADISKEDKEILETRRHISKKSIETVKEQLAKF